MDFEEWKEKNLERLHKEFWENNQKELERYIKDEFEVFENERD